MLGNGATQSTGNVHEGATRCPSPRLHGLQKLGDKLGVKVESTPKFHCEMAGEGIEYDWGVCKAKNINVGHWMKRKDVPRHFKILYRK